jgi:hypothetical protein
MSLSLFCQAGEAGVEPSARQSVMKRIPIHHKEPPSDEGGGQRVAVRRERGFVHSLNFAHASPIRVIPSEAKNPYGSS